MEKVREKLCAAGVDFIENAALFTTFGSGGEARYIACPQNAEELRSCFRIAREEGLPCRVFGGGSNVLLSDDGYHGMAVRLAKWRGIETANGRFTVGAGVKLPTLARYCLDAALSGAEFMAGIPGETGGAVYMNASAFGSGISDILSGVMLLMGDEVVRLSASELSPSYHRGGLPAGSVLLQAEFSLAQGDRAHIEARMTELVARRKATQPGERSAGSVFRPVGKVPAALYIEKSGLKGARVGGAELSTKHCNFIINRGGATTKDYFSLGEAVRRAVRDQSGVTLEYEVEYINADG